MLKSLKRTMLLCSIAISSLIQADIPEPSHSNDHRPESWESLIEHAEHAVALGDYLLSIPINLLSIPINLLTQPVLPAPSLSNDPRPESWESLIDYYAQKGGTFVLGEYCIVTAPPVNGENILNFISPKAKRFPKNVCYAFENPEEISKIFGVKYPNKQSPEAIEREAIRLVEYYFHVGTYDTITDSVHLMDAKLRDPNHKTYPALAVYLLETLYTAETVSNSVVILKDDQLVDISSIESARLDSNIAVILARTIQRYLTESGNPAPELEEWLEFLKNHGARYVFAPADFSACQFTFKPEVYAQGGCWTYVNDEKLSEIFK